MPIEIKDPYPSVDIDPVWFERWKQQRSYLQQLADKYENSASVRVKTTLRTLVCSLRAFADKQINGLIDGFRRGKFQPCDQYPPEVVLSAMLAQVGFDIALFEQIATQREYASTLPVDDPYVKALAVGDQLAYTSLGAAKRAGYLRETNTTVLTYFQKSAQVRVIPYAPVVLVGIPHSSIGINRDFLAIPHEVGHYLYRHGLLKREDDSELKDELPVVVLRADINVWVKNWFEEVFADVFGALVAGPVIGLDFQDLQKTHKTDDFYADKGVHPVPMLRPEIYHKAIAENASDRASDWAKELHNHWEVYLETRDDAMPSEIVGAPGPKPNRKFKRGDGHKFLVGDAITYDGGKTPPNSTKPIDEAILIILQGLLKNITPTSWPDFNTLGTPPVAPSQESNDLGETLYSKFDSFIAALPIQPPPPDLTYENDTVYVNGNATKCQGGKTLFPEQIDNPRDQLYVLDDNQVYECKEWLSIWDSRGWVTKGPQCESPGTCD